MMTDKLRAAAQAALSAMDYMLRNGEWYCAEERANALRAALAEPAIKESLTVAVQERMHPEIKKMYEDYFDKCFRESSAQKRPWVGLTDDDKTEIKKLVTYDQFETAGEYANRVQAATESKLKEKNGG